jgi:ubiquinone/menaquinone biosynthesis C-methylase UbiE
MGLYQDWVVPRLVELVNLPLYGRAVGRVFALDPSPELLRLARDRATIALAPVSLVRASAEQLPFANEASTRW